jgi:small subunit ribosomal protein S4e
MRLKRLAFPLAKEKKKAKYIVAPRGPHPLKHSIALACVLRDWLGFTENLKETKKVIKQGKILVDGRAIKDHKFGVGLFDTILIPDMNKYYRVIPTKKGLEIIEIAKDEAQKKICKIIDKTAVKGGKIQLNLHDGKNILADNSFSTQDSVLIELPSQKFIKRLEFKEGMLALVIAGKNVGKIGKIKKIERGWKLNRVLLSNEEEFYVPFKNIIVIGEDKPEIRVSK